MYLSKYRMPFFSEIVALKSCMCIIFKNLIWVPQNAVCENAQYSALDCAASFM
jgi:hypothetical protein